MKFARFLSIIIVLCTGCVIKTESQPEELKIVTETRVVTPVNPSPSYLAGYKDGYYGTWLGPARWLVKNDYRNGWSAGNYDRTHNLPNAFEPKPTPEPKQ